MKPRTLADIALACEGQLLGAGDAVLVQTVSTDTRELRAGDLFVALRGEVHDGHDYVGVACEKGAVAVVVSRDLDVACPRVIVADTLATYGRLGALARSDSDALFIAVTGSAGKTTTKDMLGSILSLAGPSLVTPRTENNEIGIPRLLLQLQAQHRYCVLELGMRGPGEIAYLADISRPQIGIITNVGEAHIGRLGSKEAVAKAKAELLAALPTDGRAVLNANDFFFGLLCELAPCPVVSFGFGAAPAEAEAHVTAEDIRAVGVEPARFCLCVGTDRRGIRLQLPGRHNVANALAAAAAALAAGIGLETIRAGLESYGGQEMRSQVVRGASGCTIIDDTYNASPTSTPEALRMLGGCEGRRVFVFGAMLELGAETEAAHREVGRLAAKCGVDWLVAVGEPAAFAAQEAEALGLQVNTVAGVGEALALLEGALGEGDTVLVKASRGAALEAVVKGLRDDG